MEEFQELILLDVLVRGHLRHEPDTPEVWLAMEVSSVVDRNDVKRARRRAALLRKAGYRAIPTVAGEEVTEGGEEAAREGRVLRLSPLPCKRRADMMARKAPENPTALTPATAVWRVSD